MLRIICTFAVLAAGIAGPRATAAVFAVTLTNDLVDVSPGDGVCDANPTAGVACSLRAAVQEANALAGDDAISLPAGTYAVTLSGLEDDAAAGDLDVTSGITIEGDGAGVSSSATATPSTARTDSRSRTPSSNGATSTARTCP